MDDANKFTELQIKLLEKIKGGEISLTNLEWFINLSPPLRDTLMEMDLAGELGLEISKYKDALNDDAVKTLEGDAFSKSISNSGTISGGKLGLIADLGVIKIPADYDHIYATDYSKRFFTYFQKDRPSAVYILHPGENIRIKLYKVLPVNGITVEEIKKQPEFGKAIEAGVQGAVLVLQQKGAELMKILEAGGIWGCVSFGNKITDTIYAYLNIGGCHIVDYAEDNFRFLSTMNAILCLEPADEENESQQSDTQKETNENSADEKSVKETKPQKPWEL